MISVSIGLDRTIEFYTPKKEIFCEHVGLEIMLKLNRTIHEFNNLADSSDRLTLSLDSYGDIAYRAVLYADGLTFLYGDKNISLTKKEMAETKKRIVSFLNINYGFSTVDYSIIDPMFLEQVLGVDLPYLIKAEVKHVKLDQMRNFSVNCSEGIPLMEGRYFKQISTGVYINSPRHKNNFVWQSNERRMKSVFEAMRCNNYSQNGSLIVLYNDSFVIRDGEHRAAALRFLYGNIEIPVLVLSFSKNYYSYKLYYEAMK